MLYGREARIGADVLLGEKDDSDSKDEITDNPHSWVTLHQRRLQDAYAIARQRISIAADKRKKYFDKKAREAPLHIGQLVFIRNRGVKGRNKIQDAYKPEPYKVIAKRDNQDVYCIERADGQGETKWMNRSELREKPTHMIESRGTRNTQKNKKVKTTSSHFSSSSETGFVCVEDQELSDPASTDSEINPGEINLNEDSNQEPNESSSDDGPQEELSDAQEEELQAIKVTLFMIQGLQ